MEDHQITCTEVRLHKGCSREVVLRVLFDKENMACTRGY